MKHRTCWPLPGFTLIELLVVIAVISVLASLLIPSLANSRERSRVAFCANNLNQLGKALMSYADEHRDSLPAVSINTANSAWDRALLPYLGNATNVFACPSDPYKVAGPIRSYAVNGGINYFADPTRRSPFGGYRQTPPPLRLGDLDYNRGDMILIGERPGNSTASRGLVGGYPYCGMDQISSTVHHGGKGANYLMASLAVRFLTTNDIRTTTTVNYWTLHTQ